MKKRHLLLYNILIFVLAQLFWLMLLGLWIYWYVSNYIILGQVGEKLSPQISYDGTNVFVLVGGLILLVAISFSMSLIFRHLNIQLKITKMYDNFIANITHELKSPLSSIQLHLETLNTRNVSEEKQKEFLELMLKDSNRLKNLIDSILEISALEQKKISHNYQMFNAESLINKIINESIEQYKLKPGTITINGNANCKCVVDYGALKIVFNNLIDNAIKYSSDKPEIEILLRCNSKKLMIDFSDKGIGISSKENRKIFNKFYRIYNPNSPSVKGTGLGLYWVQEIIKTHGGKISVHSEGENKGVTFKLELPIVNSGRNKYLNKLLKNSTGNNKNEEPVNE